MIFSIEPIGNDILSILIECRSRAGLIMGVECSSNFCTVHGKSNCRLEMVPNDVAR